MKSIVLSWFYSIGLLSAPISWGLLLEGFPLTIDSIQEAKKSSGRNIRHIGFYCQWSENRIEEELLSTLSSIDQEQSIPMMTWEPWMNVGSEKKSIDFMSLLGGEYDPYLRQVARYIKSWGKPVWIRFAHEMNLSQYHWGGEVDEYGAKSPEIYISMWRYVVTLFKNEGVNNVLWVFCPNVDSIPNEPWNKATAYYPGDDYVDLIAMDGYDFGPDSRSARVIFTPLYEELKPLLRTKPLFIGETATFLQGEARLKWISEMEATFAAWDVKAIFWFHINKERNWALP